MNAKIATIPSRIDVVDERNTQAQLFLRGFDPKMYSTYYARIYDADAYLEQIGIEKICELIEHGNSVFNIAEKIDLSVRTLRRWIASKAFYKKEVDDAYRFAADGFAYKAEQVLKKGRFGEKTNGKLSEHYRWLASKLDKERYGEAKKEDQSKTAPLSINLNFGGETKQIEKEVKTVSPLIASFMKLEE